MRYLVGYSLFAALLVGCGRSDGEPDVVVVDDTAPATPAGPAASSTTPPAATDGGGPLELDALTLTVPEGWGRKQAGSSFVLAELVLPRAEGDDADGRLTVSTAGGGVEANVERWRGQFGDQPENDSVEKIDVNGLEVTRVDFSGEFKDQRGPFAPATMRPGYRMLAAIIPVDGQLHFIKAVGPQKTIAAHAEKFDAFVRSAKAK